MNLFLKLFACIMIFSLVSCGGDDMDDMEPDPEPMEDPIPEGTASITINNSANTVNSITGKIIDSNVGGWGIRNLELSFVDNTMGIMDIDVQNFTIQTPGICVRNEVYKFTPTNSECQEVEGANWCNKATIRYSESDGTRWTSNLNVGTLEITSCDIDSNVVSGVFSGSINRIGFADLIEISGEFENVDIQK